MKMTRHFFWCLALTLIAAAGLSASTLDITAVAGSFQNSVPVAGVTINNGNPTSTIRWGQPATSSGQSGYDFTRSITLPETVTLPAGGGTTSWVELADFTHVNFPVFAPSLTSVQLRLDMGLDVGGNLVNQSFLYLLTHDETPNQTPCAYPSVTPCADRVTISAPSAGVFVIGNVTYTLQLAFSADGNPNSAISQFITQEGQRNTASIFGRFTTELGNIENPIPEPSTYALMGLGLVALAFRRKRAN